MSGALRLTRPTSAERGAANAERRQGHLSLITLVVAVAFAYWERRDRQRPSLLVRGRLRHLRRHCHVGLPGGRGQEGRQGEDLSAHGRTRHWRCARLSRQATIGAASRCPRQPARQRGEPGAHAVRRRRSRRFRCRNARRRRAGPNRPAARPARNADSSPTSSPIIDRAAALERRQRDQRRQRRALRVAAAARPRAPCVPGAAPARRTRRRRSLPSPISSACRASGALR